jgi:hypothetical protein
MPVFHFEIFPMTDRKSYSSSRIFDFEDFHPFDQELLEKAHRVGFCMAEVEMPNNTPLLNAVGLLHLRDATHKMDFTSTKPWRLVPIDKHTKV